MPKFAVSEEIDRSHRHFSGLLWLYPGTFLPSAKPITTSNDRSDDEPNLYEAAYNLLQTKIEAGGGHTAWSSVWEACLMARLRKDGGIQCFIVIQVAFFIIMLLWNSGLEKALQKLLARYFTPNLLSVHPAIKLVPPSPHNDNFGCESCYRYNV